MTRKTQSRIKLMTSMLSLFLLLTIKVSAQQPAFTSQPSDATVCEGNTANYSVTATNVNTYHWHIYNSSNNSWSSLTNSSTYSGVNTATLSVVSNSSLDGNIYRCLIFGTTPQYFEISNEVSLNIDLLPNVTADPVQQTIFTGGNASYSVTATGTNLTYQWQENTGSGWNNLSNTGVYSDVTTSTLSITGATLSMNSNLYRCVVSGKCSPASRSQSAILNVALPLSFNSQPSNAIVCEGGNTSFSVSANNVNTYQWEVFDGSNWSAVSSTGIYSGAKSSVLTITGAPLSIQGYEYRCRIYSPYAQNLASNTVSITINTAPAITSQPINSVSSTNGNATFSITATGTALTYQWQENTGSGWTNVSNGGVYSGATTNSLTLTSVPNSMDNYEYRCIVSGTCSPTATSNNAKLTVTSPPAITSHPTNTTICEGSNTTFSVTATNANTYVWQENTGSGWNNINNGGVFSGATTATLTITGATTSMNSNTYRCVVFNASTQIVISNSASITVDELPEVTDHPSDRSICINGNTTFSVTATGTNITYQWQVDDGNGWTDLTNAGNYNDVTTSTLSVSNITLAMDGYEYRCVVSGKCTPADNSDAAELNVDLPANITNHPTDGAICDGSDIDFTVSATGASLKYRWQVNDGSGWTNISNNSTYSGATTRELTVTADPTLDQYEYRCVVTGKCSPSETSTAAKITVDILPGINTQPTPATVCEGTNASYTIAADGTDLDYQWQVNDGSGFTDINDGGMYSGTSTDALNLTNVPYSMNMYEYRCIVSGKCSPDVTSDAVLLEVQLTTEVLSNIKADTFCENGSDFIAINTQGVGLSYKWQLDDGTGYTDLTNGGTFSGVNTDILSLTNAPTSIDGQYIRCIVNGVCKSDTTEDIKAVISYKPQVVTPPSNVTTIQGQDATFSVVTTGTALTYQWQSSTGGAFSNINDNAVYNGTKTSQLTIKSTTEAQNNFTYRCIVKGIPNCQFNNDTSSSAVLNVNPPLSVGSTTLDAQIALYPNPTSGNYVSVRSDLNTDLTYSIVDKVGRVITTGEIAKDQQVSQISVEQLPAGIYIITFSEDDNKIQTTRFTKL